LVSSIQPFGNRRFWLTGAEQFSRWRPCTRYAGSPGWKDRSACKLREITRTGLIRDSWISGCAADRCSRRVQPRAQTCRRKSRWAIPWQVSSLRGKQTYGRALFLLCSGMGSRGAQPRCSLMRRGRWRTGYPAWTGRITAIFWGAVRIHRLCPAANACLIRSDHVSRVRYGPPTRLPLSRQLRSRSPGNWA